MGFQTSLRLDASCQDLDESPSLSLSLSLSLPFHGLSLSNRTWRSERVLLDCCHYRVWRQPTIF